MGATERPPRLLSDVSVVGGAVKAGLLGPPVGGALRAPVVQFSPATMGSGPPAAVLG